MRNADFGPDFWKTRGVRGYLGIALNICLIGIGFLFLGGGTYASVESIRQGYKGEGFGGPFSCASNGV
ncbi:unnamed protein product [Cercospora beticola]|nr:unnamed protein product [Cercospora beticola]